MALFRKIFYKKPPDGLLEISERVYVFDYCFSTDVLEEDDYKVYIGGITEQLREHFPDASFMVFNFREGERESQISSILSEYDMTVMDYPRHYEGCPLLTMEMIHHFLRSSESWLCLGPHNVLLMHCERGGWPVLAFMLAALLIYCKQYTGEQKTLEMIYKQAPHELLHLLSPLDPVPSQLRYLQYVSRRNVVSEWPPRDRALSLDCIMLRMIPNFDGEGGCRPIFRIYGQDPFAASDRTTKVLFSTPKKSKYVRLYRQTECELVKIDIHCHIQGDVVLECISLDDDLEREEMMFRVMFNTAFIRSNIMMVNCDQIDILWDSKDRFPKDFRAEVLLSEMDAASSVVNMELTSGEEKEGLPIEAFAKVKEIFSNVDWHDLKGDAALHVLQQLTSDALQEISEVLSPRAMPWKSTHFKLTEKADHDVSNNNAVSDVNKTMRSSLLSYSSSAASGSSEPASNQKISVIPSPPPPPPLLPLATTPKVSTTNLPSASPPPPPPPPLIQSSVMPSPPLSSLSSSPPPDHLPPLKSVATIPHPPPPPPFLGASSTHRKASSNTSTKSLSTPPHPPPPPSPPPPPTSSTQCPPAPPMKKPGGLVGAPPPPPPPPSRPKTAAPMASPSAPPPPPPPQFTPKQSAVPTPPKPSPVPTVPPPMSSQGSLKSSQSSSIVSKATGSEFVPPPPAALPSSSLGVKGRSLSHAKGARSLQSTQSSSKRISLKPLHWVKVTRAMQGSLWAETEKSDEASKAPEIDMSDLAEFFSTNSESGLSERTRRRSSLGGKPDKVHLIDLRRANNCEIMLTKVKIPLPDLMSSLLALDDSLLDADQVDNLIKFCPTKEEMDLLKGYNGDKEKLGKCEQFFLELMKVPRVEAKLRVFSFKIQFRTQVSDLRSSLNIVNSAAEEIRNSVKLKRIMQTILSLGNALNQGTARGSAIGFRLDSLLKLIDTRARNNKMTLMHYLCKVLADKLPEVLDFPKDLVSLEAASKIQLKILAEEMQAISKGLEKVEQELTSSENDGLVSATFRKTLKEFLVVAEAEVRSLTSLYSGVGRNADALALYFGEDPARCPFEQVISTLLNFTKMFERAHEENCKQLELEKKKSHQEAENVKLKLASHKRETENVLQPPIRSGETQ